MSTLYNQIVFLCKEKGIKGGRMCTDLGFSKSLVTDLKSGRKKGVSAETAQKIASYFGVSVGYLLGEEKEQPTTQGEPVSPKMAELIEQIKKLPEEKIDLLLRVAESIQLQ